MLMADVRVDDRDLRLLLGALEDLLADIGEDVELTGNERQAYLRLCALIGRRPSIPAAYEQQSLGFLGDDEPPHPDEPRSSGRGIMGDYIERTKHYLRGGEGLPWPPRGTQHPIAEPKPDPAKEIAAKMARASHDAATGKATPKPTEQPKRPLTDEEREALRRALDGDGEQ